MGYCPVQEKEMKPKEYVPPVKTPKLINFLIKVSDEIARKRGIYPRTGLRKCRKISSNVQELRFHT